MAQHHTEELHSQLNNTRKVTCQPITDLTTVLSMLERVMDVIRQRGIGGGGGGLGVGSGVPSDAVLCVS